MIAQESLAELRKRPHWSFSSINTFLNICSLQWAFRYVYRHESVSTPVALVFGKAFHRALEYAARLRMDGEEVVPETAQTLFCDLLHQLAKATEPKITYPEGVDIDVLCETGGKMLGVYLDGIDPDEKVLQVSAPFSVFFEEADGSQLSKPLIGEFDCVVEKQGRPVIVDWKSSARRWPKNKEHLDLQPTCYMYAALQNGGRADTLFRFDIVTKAKTPVAEQRATVRHPDHFLRLIETVKVMEKMIRGELFLPNDQSWSCKGCAYGLSCQAWHKERSRSLYNFKLVA